MYRLSSRHHLRCQARCLNGDTGRKRNIRPSQPCQQVPAARVRSDRVQGRARSSLRHRTHAPPRCRGRPHGDAGPLTQQLESARTCPSGEGHCKVVPQRLLARRVMMRSNRVRSASSAFTGRADVGGGRPPPTHSRPMALFCSADSNQAWRPIFCGNRMSGSMRLTRRLRALHSLQQEFAKAADGAAADEAIFLPDSVGRPGRCAA